MMSIQLLGTDLAPTRIIDDGGDKSAGTGEAKSARKGRSNADLTAPETRCQAGSSAKGNTRILEILGSVHLPADSQTSPSG